MNDSARKLRRIGSIRERGNVSRRRRNEVIFRSNLTLAGSEFYRVGAAK